MNHSRQRAWAATGLSPHAGLAALGPDVDPWTCWARAVLVMAGGDYAAAFAILEPLTLGADEVAGLAAARIGSGLRQLDEHVIAVRWDDRAISAPGQAGVDGLIGRAADAVGVLDAAAASRFLDQVCERVGSARDRVRVDWVSCEIELLTDQPARAVTHAESALATAEVMASPRHVVKSKLFLGAALRVVDPARAIGLLHDGAAEAQRLSLLPLLWPMVVVLGDAATAAEGKMAGRAVRVIEASLPAGFGAGWVARGDIGRLRSTR